MAGPDLARPNKVEGHMAVLQPTTTTGTSVLTTPANSLYRMRTIYIANTTATAQTFSLSISRAAANGGGAYALHSGVTIPAKNLFNATTVDDAIYLDAGDSIFFAQGATGVALNLFIFYEAIT